MSGKFNISANFSNGSGVGTVTLQRKFGSSGATLDIEAYTSDTEKQAEEPEDDVYYRLGVKTGDYTSGTIALRVSQ